MVSKINAGFSLGGEFITRFGGGVNAFSRYENGKTKPPLALVELLKVLDRHPDLLDEVKVA
jgi:HTH-type transcriptional regulator/antitoxin MqsA